ncbi:SLC13 family permease [Desulfurispirillum indicum]|uniref:SLC13 family permease n=1 Tax=Desulfurispirillum indicum TaxID=936456 RepID=UPI001CFAE1F3|nr:SLC13 family permease [Desulfurispirillum indicum]UCZ56840.1 SLC13 family permease [Desulfurispirillum indicum]
MPTEQWFILSILAGTLAMFLWGRWRHDMVAGGALLACVLVGLVPGAEAFSGFGHPAVITVACVLVLSRGLQLTGAVDALAQRMLPSNPGPIEAIAALTLVGAVLSAFMNNVGALALLMPIAVQLARRLEIPPGRVLMPLAFGTILGGMTTLIGTPPNLLVSGFRAENGSGSFSMFDFSAVGGVVALTGIVFIALIGWRLVPRRQQAGGDSFETSTYFTEVRVEEKSKAAGKTLEEIEAQLEEADAQIVALVRNEYRVTAPNMRQLLRAGDILIIEADPESLSAALSGTGLQLEEAVAVDGGEGDEEAVLQEASTQESDAGNGEKEQRGKEDDEIVLQELVIMPHSAMVGRSASDVQIRTRYGLNLLAIARQGSRTIRRLRSTPVQSGDVLLMQGRPEALSAFASEISGVPLAQRSIDIPDKRKATIAMLVMAAAVAGAAFGLLPAAISFAAGMLAFMALRIVPLRSVYNSIDWTVIVLLGAMIPVAGAMADTGAADMLAGLLLENIARGSAVAAVVVLLVVTMTLSDFMNNAATAAVMCQIAISTALQLGVNADTYLMAVAVGASCSFLTPIGHQNNTLILGPGGFRFGDYWRLGLPMEILVVAVGVPMILWVWPLV